MLDPKNMLNVTAGVVADPEVINDKIAKFRVAIEYAGPENVGYFDVTYYLKDSEGFVNKNASFVAGQINAGKLKKGSQISIIGRIFQERWQQDGQNRSRVAIVAEHLSYAGSLNSKGDSSKSSDSAPAPSKASIPSEF